MDIQTQIAPALDRTAISADPADRYASLPQIETWARVVMRRQPDVTIGTNYLRRWWIVPRNLFANVYLHEFRRSDDDRALHDHPWENSSYLIAGRYIEHTPEGQFLRAAGDFVTRPATARHRIELIAAQPVISLFMTGPKIRDWGFHCPGGFVPWQDFVARGDQGCGA